METGQQLAKRIAFMAAINDIDAHEYAPCA
jgi:hypothetical protein